MSIHYHFFFTESPLKYGQEKYLNLTKIAFTDAVTLTFDTWTFLEKLTNLGHYHYQIHEQSIQFLLSYHTHTISTADSGCFRHETIIHVSPLLCVQGYKI